MFNRLILPVHFNVLKASAIKANDLQRVLKDICLNWNVKTPQTKNALLKQRNVYIEAKQL